MFRKAVSNQSMQTDAAVSATKATVTAPKRKLRNQIIGIIIVVALFVWTGVVLWIAHMHDTGEVGKVIASDSYSNFAWGPILPGGLAIMAH